MAQEDYEQVGGSGTRGPRERPQERSSALGGRGKRRAGRGGRRGGVEGLVKALPPPSLSPFRVNLRHCESRR